MAGQRCFRGHCGPSSSSLWPSLPRSLCASDWQPCISVWADAYACRERETQRKKEKKKGINMKPGLQASSDLDCSSTKPVNNLFKHDLNTCKKTQNIKIQPSFPKLGRQNTACKGNKWSISDPVRGPGVNPLSLIPYASFSPSLSHGHMPIMGRTNMGGGPDDLENSLCNVKKKAWVVPVGETRSSSFTTSPYENIMSRLIL